MEVQPPARLPARAIAAWVLILVRLQLPRFAKMEAVPVARPVMALEEGRGVELSAWSTPAKVTMHATVLVLLEEQL